EGATMADAAKLVGSIRYLVPGAIAYGMLQSFIGAPGEGKSALALDGVAGPVMLGGKRWFTGGAGPIQPANVVWLPTENDMAITLKRMRDWKLPLDRLKLLDKNDPLKSVDLGNLEDVIRVEKLVNKYSCPLVVLDSLRGGHDSDENNSRVSRFLKALAAI